MDKLVSVVVPVYNADKYIEMCANSVLSQDYENLELILVNDGSTDRSRLILEQLERKDTRVKIINIDNSGVSYARNIGIDNSNGEFIMFIDADDYISADCISYFYNAATKMNSKFVISKNHFSKPGDEQINDNEFVVWSSERCTEEFLYPKVTVGCWNKFYDLNFIKDNNIRFNTDLFFGEGLKFITDVSQRIDFACVGSRKVYTYRANDESCTAVHDVSKAKASFNALDKISDNLVVKTKSIYDALACHYWLNNFLAVRFMKVDKLNEDDKRYRRDCIIYLRRNVKDVLTSKARLKIKISSVFVWLFPESSARLFNKIKNQ
ncbi:glycosyltransferase family 2 protein [Vibrio variabilis]|uniref:glycosyltransferase family 2 protein n=1 Tax=Vibrio variabilis TaxID=990271 RepID=UPI00068B3A54|nr:glycosyltransferase family A protein [Vibrio variabilis]